MNRNVSIIVFISFIFVIVFGCKISTIIPSPQSSGSFVLSINSENPSRTILPEVKNSITSYLIDFDGLSSIPPIFTAETSVLIDLPEGAWIITVYGMTGEDGAGNVVARGTVAVDIAAEAIVDATVILSPQSAGSGNIDITISWPVTEIIDETSTIIFDGTEYDAMRDSCTIFDRKARILRFQISDIISGNYFFTAYLNQKGNLLGTVTESVQVFDNLTSSTLIDLLPEDFNLPPAAPTLLSPVEGNNEISITWETASSVITSFSIERSESEFSGYVVVGTTDGVTRTYTDTTLVIGTTYFYRVIATSAGGDSHPSNSVNLAVEPPVPGNSGILAFSDTTSNSTILSWLLGVDNVSSSSALDYKIVRSGLDNIGTLADAESNGTIVQDWSFNIDTVPVTGLSSGTTYYFNVLVRDEAENINIYNTNWETTSSDGVIDLSISVTEPNDETITFSVGDDISISQSDTLSIEITESFDSYEWYLDGLEVVGQTDSSFELVCSGTSLGVHHLSVFVTLNNMLYSNTLRFIVTN